MGIERALDWEMFGATAVGLSLFAVTAICANVAVAHDTGPNSMGCYKALISFPRLALRRPLLALGGRT